MLKETEIVQEALGYPWPLQRAYCLVSAPPKVWRDAQLVSSSFSKMLLLSESLLEESAAAANLAARPRRHCWVGSMCIYL